MNNNVSINLNDIGQKIEITIGNYKKNKYHIDNILTDWSEPFLKEFSLTTEEEQLKYIGGYLIITKEQYMYRVEGKIIFEPLLECVRSLTLFREKINTNVSGFFVPENSQKYLQSGISKAIKLQDEEIELTESDLESYPFHGNSLKLDELLVDSMFCAIPELPLCREDCKGLCSECGTDLNERDLNDNYRIVLHNNKCIFYQNQNPH
jgi:uncharacterized protein